MKDGYNMKKKYLWLSVSVSLSNRMMIGRSGVYFSNIFMLSLRINTLLENLRHTSLRRKNYFFQHIVACSRWLTSSYLLINHLDQLNVQITWPEVETRSWFLLVCLFSIFISPKQFLCFVICRTWCFRHLIGSRTWQTERSENCKKPFWTGQEVLCDGADYPKWTFQCLFSQSLITFVNKHLNKLNLEVTELESQVYTSSVN